MTEQEFQIAMSAMASQRNAALDEIVRLQVRVTVLEQRLAAAAAAEKKTEASAPPATPEPS